MRSRSMWVLAVLAAVGVTVYVEVALVGPDPGSSEVGAQPGAASETLLGAGVIEGVLSESVGEAPAELTVRDGAVRVGDKSVPLAHAPHDGLAGGLAQVVVASLDGEAIFYTMWEDWRGLDDLEAGDIGGVPVIRRVDVASGIDEVFRRGSYAPTVSSDGRIGYVEDLDGSYRYSVSNPTRVMVASPGGSGDEVWTTARDSKYITVGWSRDVLIVYQEVEGEHLRTFALSGPGESLLLSEAGVVVAISPDGTRVLLVESGPTAGRSSFVLVDPLTGARLSSVVFATPLGPIQGTYSGDWLGNRIVVGPGAGDGDQFPYVFGFAILTYEQDTLALERFVTLQGIANMASLTSPRFIAGGDVWLQVTVVSTVDGNDVWSCWEAVCSPESGSCLRVTPVRDGAEFAPIVDNWSGGSRS